MIFENGLFTAHFRGSIIDTSLDFRRHIFLIHPVLRIVMRIAIAVSAADPGRPCIMRVPQVDRHRPVSALLRIGKSRIHSRCDRIGLGTLAD